MLGNSLSSRLQLLESFGCERTLGANCGSYHASQPGENLIAQMERFLNTEIVLGNLLKKYPVLSVCC